MFRRKQGIQDFGGKSGNIRVVAILIAQYVVLLLFAILSVKSVARINQIAKNSLETAEAKYAGVWG